LFWHWLFVGPALLLALLSLRGERRRAAYFVRRLAERPACLPPASVIVPLKGPQEGLRETLAALASLDYPDYELIVVARAAGDIPPGVLPARVKVVLAHSAEDPATAEEVRNQAAAVRATRKRSEILAFASSDARVAPGWLRALAAPLAEDGVGASTGFRWFTPQPADFWSLMRGVCDAVSFGMMGPGDNRFVCSGSMAIRKETFYQARVFERWKNALSGGYTLAAAVRGAGLRIAFAPGALAASFEHAGMRGFFRWARRGMALTRLYYRRLWWAALPAHAFYCAGMAASIVAAIQGSRLAAWALIPQLLPGMWKGLRSAALAKSALPEREAWFRRHAWTHALCAPAAAWLWLIALVSTLFGRTGQ
jgi:cellulose synthase/poly-beta-1,6-N-acetylglucosamine synthase-like glycosyltransferase